MEDTKDLKLPDDAPWYIKGLYLVLVKNGIVAVIALLLIGFLLWRTVRLEDRLIFEARREAEATEALSESVRLQTQQNERMIEQGDRMIVAWGKMTEAIEKAQKR